MEVVEGDDDDQDEAAGSNAAEMTPAPISRDVSEPAPSRPPGKDEDDSQSKPASPRFHSLSVFFTPQTPTLIQRRWFGVCVAVAARGA